MKKKILFIIFVLLICGGLGFYFYKKLSPKRQNQDIVVEKLNNNSVNIGGVSIQGEGDMNGVKIEKVDIPKEKPTINIPTPDLNRDIKIIGEMSEDARRIATDKIKDISSQLKKDSNNLENWLLLGIYRKMINDYEGAILAWEYAGAISPQSSTPLNNLGDLYAYYIKDEIKAEEYFLQAIKVDPSNIYLYFKITDFYRDFKKDMNKARAILEKGIAANPSTSSDLKSLLETLK